MRKLISWIYVVAGSWLVISPWLLGFSTITIMKWNNVILGLILVIANLWSIYGPRDST